jgi:hypothetical protein
MKNDWKASVSQQHRSGDQVSRAIPVNCSAIGTVEMLD